jgi:arsenate reductase (glutaredoxin)
MPVTIYHNPRCNTSRKTLALLRDKGVEPDIVEYLKTPYTAAQLKTLLAQLKLPAKAIIRKKEAAAAGIDPAKLSEDQLVARWPRIRSSSNGRSSSRAAKRRSAGRPRRC